MAGVGLLTGPCNGRFYLEKGRVLPNEGQFIPQLFTLRRAIFAPALYPQKGSFYPSSLPYEGQFLHQLFTLRRAIFTPALYPKKGNFYTSSLP